MHVFMFPGQSSADPQMIRRALAAHPACREIADRAVAALGPAALHPYLDAAEARLDSNRDVQLAVFLATQMHLAALRAQGVEGGASLGLSLGEYSHLVHIGALTFEEALRLVDARGRAYEESRPGTMVTVLAADRETVESVVAEGGRRGTVVVSNYNAPTQHVLSGEADAVAWAAGRLEEEHGAQTVTIERRVPMHSPLMSEVAGRFRRWLERMPWRRPRHRYVPNVTGEPMRDPQPLDFVDSLAAHVAWPVRWQKSMERLAREYAAATFIEVGPGRVLHNMLGRRWLPLRRAATDPGTGATAEALRAGA